MIVRGGREAYGEVVLGRAEVRQVFKVSRVGTIVGCYVTSGKMVRSAKVRLLRNDVVTWEGKLSSLKRFKDDVREVTHGYDCGITLADFSDFREGDILEAFTMEQQNA